jgi:hypothetical protein
MKALVSSALLALILLASSVPGYSFSLSTLLGGSGEQNLDTFKVIHVADLKALMENSKEHLHIYDANVDTTREKFGVIPGARLLSSSDNYSLDLLPANKQAMLVFYCANTH